MYLVYIQKNIVDFLLLLTYKLPFVLKTDFHYDEVIDVDGSETYETARELATSDGIFLGASAAAAVLAAKEIALREENEGKKIVVILPDDGMKYLSTRMYRFD